MAEERVVFDFTNDGEISVKEQYLFEEFLKKRIIKYTIDEDFCKAFVEFVNCSNQIIICIYNKINQKDIEKRITNQGYINLSGYYIDNFDISKISNNNRTKLNSIAAKNSFWLGTINLSGISCKNGRIDFVNSIFIIKCINLSESNFDGCDIYFNGTYFVENGPLFNFSKLCGGKIEFYASCMQEIEFIETIFTSNADLRFRSINSLRIDDCTLEKTVKIAGNPETLSLKGTINLGQIHFSDEPSVIIKAIKNSFKQKNIDEVEELTEKQKLDQLILIKENYRSLGEYEGEDLAYQTYMKYKTLFMKKGIKKFFYWLFGKIGKYGTAPGNIIAWMGIFLSLFAGIYYLLLRTQFEPILKSIGNAFYFSGITFLTIGYGDIWPLCGWAKTLSVTEGFIGLFLMSYLTVAVVRKLLR